MSKDMHNLIRLLLVVLLLALVGGIVLPRTAGPRRGRLTAAKVDIATFKNAVSMFQYDCGRNPTTEEGLAALIARPPAIPAARWRGPYLDAERIRADPWGRAYVYKCPGLHNTNGYDVYSLGRHGKGGDEAIGNWTPVEPQ